MTAPPTDSTAAGPTSGRALVTIIGVDRVGIIAGIANVLAEANVNILDITPVGDAREFFTMIMMVDLAGSRLPFEELRARLRRTGPRARRAGRDPARGHLQGDASDLSQDGQPYALAALFRRGDHRDHRDGAGRASRHPHHHDRHQPARLRQRRRRAAVRQASTTRSPASRRRPDARPAARSAASSASRSSTTASR